MTQSSQIHLNIHPNSRGVYISIQTISNSYGSRENEWDQIEFFSWLRRNFGNLREEVVVSVIVWMKYLLNSSGISWKSRIFSQKSFVARKKNFLLLDILLIEQKWNYTWIIRGTWNRIFFSFRNSASQQKYTYEVYL